MKEKIPIPSMKIQKEVARIVHQIAEQSKKTKKLIDLLMEYRAALISAAVTGGIDVREG